MIKALSHVGLAVKNLAEAREFYRRVFGLDSSEPIVGGGGRVRISMIELGNCLLELMEPVGEEGPVAKFLASRGEGMHHVCYEVDDIEGETQALKARGLEPLGKPAEGAEGLTIFFHPRGTGGVLVELVEKRGS